MKLSVIDPVKQCYWCGEKSEKIFRAEDVDAQTPYVHFCACGAEHAYCYLEDIITIHQGQPPRSWRMTVITRELEAVQS